LPVQRLRGVVPVLAVEGGGRVADLIGAGGLAGLSHLDHRLQVARGGQQLAVVHEMRLAVVGLAQIAPEALEAVTFAFGVRREPDEGVGTLVVRPHNYDEPLRADRAGQVRGLFRGAGRPGKAVAGRVTAARPRPRVALFALAEAAQAVHRLADEIPPAAVGHGKRHVARGRADL